MPMTFFCSSLFPLSNSQKLATLSSSYDRACLAIKEASLSGKSESLSSSRDSEGTCLAPPPPPEGELPEVEGSRFELAYDAELEPNAASELELEPVEELELGPVSENLQASTGVLVTG